MPAQVTHYRVLISSPMDVAPERDAARAVIDEVNQQLRGEGLAFDPVAWETDVVPDFGADSQAITNPVAQ